LFFLGSCRWTRLNTTLDEVIVFPIPAALYLVKNLLQVGCVFSLLEITIPFVFLLPKIWLCVFFVFLLQYYIFAYVDAPGYQILKNLNIISTGVLYRIILKKKWVLTIVDTVKNLNIHNNSFGSHVTSLILLKIITVKECWH
jgi:hypothetical protein